LTIRAAAAVVGILACGLSAPPARSAVAPEGGAAAAKAVRHPGLHIPTRLEPAAAPLPGWTAFRDARAKRLASLILSHPLIPGDGAGNPLRWPEGAAPGEAAVGARALEALRAFLLRHRAVVGVDPAELGAPQVAVLEKGTLVQVSVPRVVGGIPVRDARLTAVLSHGNLVLLGADRWPDLSAPVRPRIPEAEARARVVRHAAPLAVSAIRSARLELVPLAKDDGYEHRLAWSLRADLAGDVGTWEALVDASDGALLAFEDRNQYARRVVGGVYPLSNDQRPPDGIEQPGWPMPFADIGPGNANAHGVFPCVPGAHATRLRGPYVEIADICGPILEGTSAGDIDLGASGGTDCAVPAGRSAGDTHAARTAYYELNRLKEQARGYLPANAWLHEPLPAFMNIGSACNAFWNGALVGFYRDGGGPCRNTGEIAGVFGHEFGHGLDDNGTNPTVSRPAGGIADIHAFLRLQDGCVGRGFWKTQVCTGYGDPCDPPPATGCTGVRHMDFMGHVCDRPHTVTWITQGFTAAECGGVPRPACPGAGTTAPCGRGDHCEGMVVSETAFDLARRDLPAAGFDADTAHELTTRLFTLAAGPVAAWYTCQVGGGCDAAGGYLNVLAADDDNGDLADGTPHMAAIRAAFERHEIHCAEPSPVSAGCAAGPVLAPSLTAAAGPEEIALSWTAAPNASVYALYRTDGVAGCDYGKVKVAEVAGTSFLDAGMLEGRAYSYVVIPVGANPSCLGRASNCATATPAPAPVCSPAADFTLSCAPSTLTVANGGSGTSTCTVQSTGGLSGPVGVGTAGLPAGTTFSVNPPLVTVPPNGSAPTTLTVTAGPRPAPGTYPFEVEGDAGPLDRRFPMTLVVPAPPAVPLALTVDAAGNGVYEPNETVVVAPAWRNVGVQALALTGTLSHPGGPAGPAYTVPDPFAGYGTIAPGAGGSCSAAADCYRVANTAAARPATHWDATALETVSAPAAKVWTLHIGGSFADVPAASPFYRFVETLLHRGVTGGCAPTTYCPANSTTREQMAAFVLLSREPPGYAPPPCVAGAEVFGDVPASSPYCRWIAELARRGVVGGCGGGAYCPAAPVAREQMAVFVLRTLDPALSPPPCGTPVFADVPASSPFCRWIEELARRGVVTGCGGGNYCPAAPVSREQMGVYLTVTFGLLLYGP
jgi:hypothetical protein